jgi:sulfite exporter TauE/SafE
MLKICISLFLTGAVLGTGPCLATCGPILISYIAATKKSPLGGLRAWFIFSITRVAIYIFLGIIAGFAGAGLFNRFYWEMPGYIIWFAGGGFISILGLLIFAGKQTHFKVCQLLNQSLIEKDTKSIITLGVLIGIFPCVPLIGVLSYITMISTHFSQGLLMSAAFGAGTLISPLILLAVLAGAIPRINILQDEKRLIIFQKICGLILFLLGFHVILKTFSEFIRMQ